MGTMERNGGDMRFVLLPGPPEYLLGYFHLPEMAESNAYVPKTDMAEQSNAYNTSFLWVIRDFITYPVTTSTAISSSEFRTKDRSLWEMNLKRNSPHLIFDIVLKDSIKELLAFVTVSFLDENFSKLEESSKTSILREGLKLSLTFNNYEKNKNLLFDNRHLILYGTINVRAGDIIKRPLNVSPYPSIIHDVGALLNSGSFHDFIIYVGDTQFLCHKAIVSSRSQYFDALFRTEMKEKMENKLILKDIEPNVFKKVLQYIYTDEIKVNEADVLQLVEASEKFLLGKLKKICEARLLSFISLQNMLQLSEISCTYDMHWLKQRLLRVLATFPEKTQDDFGKNAALAESETTKKEGQFQSYMIQKPVKTRTQIKRETEMDMTDVSNGSLDEDLELHPAEKQQFLPEANIWGITEKWAIFSNDWELGGLDDVLENGDGGIRWLHFAEDSASGLCCKLEVSVEERDIDRLLTELIIPGRREAFSNNSQSSLKKNYLSLKLTLISSSESSVILDYRFSVVSENKAKTTIDEGSRCFEIGRSTELMRLDPSKLPYSREGSHILNCKIMARRSFAHEVIFPDRETNDLKKTISALRSDEIMTDLVISNQGKNHRCHKAIVGCRWPFLAQKIEQSSEDGVVVVDEIDSDLFEKFLRFIYTDEFSVSEMEAWDLLPIARKFQMKAVRALCETRLISGLTVDNALEMYSLSKDYDTTLRNTCIQFIAYHLLEIANIHGSDAIMTDTSLLEAVVSYRAHDPNCS